jgi:dTDP-4-dehydrorhamnose 3,5-epimerase
MTIAPTPLSGLLLVQLKLHGDARGFFVERFQEKRFSEIGLPTRFVQDNHSRSSPGVLRGMHFQTNPNQGKLVGVVRGKIWDVAVDMRHNSPTFGKHYACELSDLNGRLLWIPAGFAHGFAVLGEEPADVYYKVDAPYNPQGEGGVLYSDPELGIEWPVKQPIISPRDTKLPPLAHYRENPIAF